MTRQTSEQTFFENHRDNECYLREFRESHSLEILSPPHKRTQTILLIFASRETFIKTEPQKLIIDIWS